MTRRKEVPKVVVTGIGIVSALGNDVQQFWSACLEGKTYVELIPEHWRRYYKAKSGYWSPLKLPNYAEYGLRKSDILSYDIAALNAIVASDEALSFANAPKHVFEERSGRYTIDGVNTSRAGVFVGTGLGCISSAFQNYVPHLLSGVRDQLAAMSASDSTDATILELIENLGTQPRVSPVASIKSMANSISAILSIRYGFRGPNDTCISACAAGTAAISRGFRAIHHDELDLAIAGGSEFYGDRAGGVFMAFDRLSTLAKPDLAPTLANRPFDKQRSGFLFSQGGACMLLLESEEHAKGRGAVPLARILGTANTSDAYSLVAISPEDNTIELMIRTAISDAGIAPSDISYVNAHGTSTLQNDQVEAHILGNLFGPQVMINSTKSLLGHTIGASGAIEAAVTALSIARGEVHPSINIDEPIRDLNFVNERTRATIDYALTHNFGFGGHNIGLVMSACT